MEERIYGSLRSPPPPAPRDPPAITQQVPTLWNQKDTSQVRDARAGVLETSRGSFVSYGPAKQ